MTEHSQWFDSNQPKSAYVHIPFCKHRCGYCNFTLIAGRDDLVDAFLDCLELELSRQLQSPRSVRTLFLGGGTPTHLGLPQLERMLTLLAHWLPLEELAEYSCEANPLDCSTEKLLLLRKYGVNRISLGGQSFCDVKLKRLERDHSGRALIQSVENSKAIIDNVSLDLIFAAPNETLCEWQSEVEQALKLPISHLSTYGLTIERGANFWGRMLRGDIHELDDDLQLQMYNHTIDRLIEAGWQHYEVSNFCQPGSECLHNQTYWQGNPWWAFGPGASSFHAKSNFEAPRWVRMTNHRSTTQYMRRLKEGRSPAQEVDELNLEQLIRERLVFGLRQLVGVDLSQLSQQWGAPVEELFYPYLQRYLEQNWMVLKQDRLRLTRQGLVISDSLWPDLLSD